MTKTKLAIFDMDGLMVDSETVYMNCLKTVMQGWNMYVPDEVIISSMGSDKDHCRKIYEDYLNVKIDDEELWYLVNKVREKYFIEHPLKPKKGIYELFDYLDSHNINRALGTSARPERTKKFLEPLNLYEGFVLRYTGDMAPHSKPHKDFYTKLIEMAHVKPEEAIIFEDSLNGLNAALNAGIRCVLVPDVVILPEEDRRKAAAVIEDLSMAIPLFEDNKL